MFVYVSIERDDQPAWIVTFGNRDKALEFAAEINALTEDVWSDSYHNFAQLIPSYGQPLPDEARGRIVEEINELADEYSDVERVT